MLDREDVTGANTELFFPHGRGPSTSQQLSVFIWALPLSEIFSSRTSGMLVGRDKITVNRTMPP